MISLRLKNLISIAKQLPLPSHSKASLELVSELQQSFDQLTLEDLNIDDQTDLTSNKLLYLNPAYKTPYGYPISYYPLLENKSFTLSIFAMPRGSTIPLHSHPHMQILSKMLYGSITIDSFEQLQENEKDNNNETKTTTVGSINSNINTTTPQSQSISAIYRGRQVMTKENCRSFLSPDSVLHRFRSLESSSAILELLFPPYEYPQRNCTYYREMGAPTSDGKVRFQPFEPDFYCASHKDHPVLDKLNFELKNLYSDQ
ncbi:hypothetical protein PPL_01259 [Heterostelium album PN500]|uniref:Cysteine dioxygenase n=1 Tax=Heterostelium pallidum (strain ATCC 26659 / Pp 5 / PN500) TaxID=670386 RepID=D3AYJ9_HETP5|nr:hypothetical protein PPL_01259 [Heterostelium album PN500]EFA86026.1 hypothetical protein PPL_01259 [Heterostelium album PN500]|eukprot:XP_020438132.1 hypothetical protein PPL_01259 [Heterostelium album PN500]